MNALDGLWINDAQEREFPSPIQIVKSHRWLISDIIFSVLGIQILAIIIPVTLQIALDKIVSPTISVNLGLLSTVLIAALMFEAAIRYLLVVRYSQLAVKINSQLHTEAIHLLLQMPLKRIQESGAGDVIAKFKEIDRIINFFSNAQNIQVLSNIPFIVIYLSLLFFYSVKLTLISLCIFPAIAISLNIANKKLGKAFSEKHQADSSLSGFIVESLKGMEYIKSCSAEPWRLKIWSSIHKTQLNAFDKSNWHLSYLLNSFEVIGKAATLSPIIYGIYLAMTHEISIGTLAVFSVIFGRVLEPVIHLGSLFANLQQIKVSYKKIQDLFEYQEQKSRGLTSIDHSPRSIKFSNVWFAYPNSNYDCLKNLNFTMGPNEFIGIAGPTGSGKSTIAKLLLTQLQAKSGEIHIGDQNIDTYDSNTLSQFVGAVHQDSALFNASILENITMGNLSISEKKVKELAISLGCDDFIGKLKDGYQTQISSGDENLSGGQRQQICILRALARNSDILIMDEPTSAMDYATERRIMDSIVDLYANKTLIVIAHRLSTIRSASKILVMDNGSIADQGTHDVLINKGGYYAKAINLQAGVTELAEINS